MINSNTEKMSSEDHYIKNTEDAIRTLRLGTKDRAEVMKRVGFNLNRLKLVNEGMYLDLLEKYKNVLKSKNTETKIEAK